MRLDKKIIILITKIFSYILLFMFFMGAVSYASDAEIRSFYSTVFDDKLHIIKGENIWINEFISPDNKFYKISSYLKKLLQKKLLQRNITIVDNYENADMEILGSYIIDRANVVVNISLREKTDAEQVLIRESKKFSRESFPQAVLERGMDEIVKELAYKIIKPLFAKNIKYRIDEFIINNQVVSQTTIDTIKRKLDIQLSENYFWSRSEKKSNVFVLTGYCYKLMNTYYLQVTINEEDYSNVAIVEFTDADIGIKKDYYILVPGIMNEAGLPSEQIDVLRDELVQVVNKHNIFSAQKTELLKDILYKDDSLAKVKNTLPSQFLLRTWIRQQSSRLILSIDIVDIETLKTLNSHSFLLKKDIDTTELKRFKSAFDTFLQPRYTSSTFYGNAHRAGNAFDNDQTTSWQAALKNKTGYLEVNYAIPRNINKVSFYCDSDNYGNGVPRRFTIQYKQDGAWKILMNKEFINHESLWSLVLQNPVVSDSWRININSVIGTNKSCFISEFKLEYN